MEKDTERNHAGLFSVFTLGNEETKAGYISIPSGSICFEGNGNSIYGMEVSIVHINEVLDELQHKKA